MLVILSKTSPNWYVLFFYFLLNWSLWVNSLKLDPRSGRFSEGLEHSTANSGKCRSDFEELRVNTYALLTVHVNLHVSTMAIASVIFIPIMMVMFFYPYRFLCVIILIILILLYIIRFIKLLIEVRMLSKLNFVNIFLYLCTVEILPVLVMVKIVVNVV